MSNEPVYKPCVDCKHHEFDAERRWFVADHRCRRKVRNENNVITGETQQVGTAEKCAKERTGNWLWCRVFSDYGAFGTRCGKEGRFFEINVDKLRKEILDAKE